MTTSTLEYTQEKQGGFLSRMFNKITAPMREYIAEIKDDLEDSRLLKLWENDEKAEHRQDNIFWVLNSVYTQAESLEDLEKYIDLGLENNKDTDFHRYGKITKQDILDYHSTLTDEKKGELLQARHDFKNENNPVLET